MSASLYLFVVAILGSNTKASNMLALAWFISLFIDFK
jgi:hypothetical protein